MNIGRLLWCSMNTICHFRIYEKLCGINCAVNTFPYWIWTLEPWKIFYQTKIKFGNEYSSNTTFLVQTYEYSTFALKTHDPSIIFVWKDAICVGLEYSFGPEISTSYVTLVLWGRTKLLQGVFLTVPPNLQYQNGKRWAANQRFCSIEFSMYKRSLLVEQRFSF